jgi:hypothetical protein
MTTFEAKLVDPRRKKPFSYKGFCPAIFTGK